MFKRIKILLLLAAVLSPLALVSSAEAWPRVRRFYRRPVVVVAPRPVVVRRPVYYAPPVRAYYGGGYYHSPAISVSW